MASVSEVVKAAEGHLAVTYATIGAADLTKAIASIDAMQMQFGQKVSDPCHTHALVDPGHSHAVVDWMVTEANLPTHGILGAIDHPIGHREPVSKVPVPNGDSALRRAVRERDEALRLVQEYRTAENAWYALDVERQKNAALALAEIQRLHDILGRAGVSFTAPVEAPPKSGIPLRALRQHAQQTGIRTP